MTGPEYEAACLIAAHEYAARGWRVIPIKPRDDEGASGKYPVGFAAWQDKATTDAHTIERWWGDKYRGYGIGIVTGRESGLWVLDVDVSHGKVGADSFADLENLYGELPECAQVITGSGGSHLYVAYTDDYPEDVRNNAGTRLGRDLDVRGDGGFVVAPPTIHPETGTPYTWDVGMPDEPMQAPPWLVELVSHVEVVESNARPREVGPNASPGDRYAAMYSWADILAVEGWTLDRIDRWGEHHWVRPGKDARQGTSATTGYTEVDNLCVFTTSLPWLPPAQYTKLGYVAHARFGGDLKAATAAMVESGSVTPSIDSLFSEALQSRLRRDTPSAHLPPTGTASEAGDDAADGTFDDVSEAEPEPLPLLPIERDKALPSWPVDCLPDWVAAHCRETAERLQSPLDLSCQFALGALAAITMGHVTIRRGSWVEPTNLYVWCAVHSGAGKSPTEKAIMAPLRSWANGRKTATNDEYRLELSKWRALQKQAREAEESYATTKGTSVNLDDLAAALNAAAGEPPQPFRLTIDDATPQRLVQLLGMHKRLAVVSAEGGLFDTVVGQFGRGQTPAVDVYLKAWSGDTIERDRVGSDGVSEQVSVEDALLTMALAVQPSVIERYQQTAPELRGRGFFARYMPSIPSVTPGYRTLVDLPATDAAEVYRGRFMALADKLNNTSSSMEMGLTSGALALFDAWYDLIEQACRPDGALYVLGEMAAKIRSSVLRTAALIAVAEGEYRAVSSDEMRRAITIGMYWIQHALEMERSADVTVAEDDRTAGLALKIVKHLGRRGGVSTPRDVWQSFKRAYGLKTVEDVTPAIAMLIERGWVVITEGTADGIGVRGAVVTMQLTQAGGQVKSASVGDLITATTTLSAGERGHDAPVLMGSGADATPVLIDGNPQGIRDLDGTGALGAGGVPLETEGGKVEEAKTHFTDTTLSSNSFTSSSSPSTPAPVAPVLSETPENTEAQRPKNGGMALPPTAPNAPVLDTDAEETTTQSDDDDDEWF